MIIHSTMFIGLKNFRDTRWHRFKFIWFFLPEYLINIKLHRRFFLLFSFIYFLYTLFTFLPFLLTSFLSRTIYLFNGFSLYDSFCLVILNLLIFSFWISFFFQLIKFAVFFRQLTFVLICKWYRLMPILCIFNNFPL